MYSEKVQILHATNEQKEERIRKEKQSKIIDYCKSKQLGSKVYHLNLKTAQ